jgi:hypothetical protein
MPAGAAIGGVGGGVVATGILQIIYSARAKGHKRKVKALV